jgi:glycosyltransferase involved in cell wall biosynthesis
MSRTRIAFVTSRFWPISGVSQILAGELAVGFRDLGSEVEIITSRWEHRWNKSFQFRGIPVHRLPVSSTGPWSNFRSQRALGKQLAREWDAVVIFGIEDHFEPTVKALSKTGTRVVLRLDDSVSARQLWPQNVSRKIIAALEQVDSIVCTNESTRERLVALDLKTTQIHVIPDGVPGSTQTRTINQQSQSRLALSDAHPVLAIEQHEPLVVTGVPFNGDGGIYDLIRAWKLVARRHPRSRLWVLGDGSQAREIWSHITESNLVYSIIMPGFFDSLDDPFHAADIYINPARDRTGQACLARAMANGVCPISTDDVNGLIEDQINGLLVPRQDPTQISQTILSLIEDGNRRNQLGLAAMESVREKLPFEATLTKYIDLIQGFPKSSTCESAQ